MPCLAGIEPRGRLIEKQELEGTRHRSGQLDQSALAGRQVSDGASRDDLKAAADNRVLGSFAYLGAFQGRAPQVLPHPLTRKKHLRAHRDVLKHGLGVEQLHTLKRPTESGLRPGRGAQMVEASLPKPDGSGRRNDPRRSVEEGCLAGTVRSDEAGDCARFGAQADGIDGRQASETNRDIGELQVDGCHPDTSTSGLPTRSRSGVCVDSRWATRGELSQRRPASARVLVATKMATSPNTTGSYRRMWALLI